MATTRFWAGQEKDLGAAEDVELPGRGLRLVYEKNRVGSRDAPRASPAGSRKEKRS